MGGQCAGLGLLFCFKQGFYSLFQGGQGLILYLRLPPKCIIFLPQSFKCLHDTQGLFLAQK